MTTFPLGTYSVDPTLSSLCKRLRVLSPTTAILKLTVLTALGAALPLVGVAQHHDSSGASPARIFTGLGEQHHPVSTSNHEAQRFFDQGLTFVYAFNHDEAVRSFQKAAELDSNLAIAHWGVALALGPNINSDVDPDREKAAFEAVHKALSLSAGAPENERSYIEALAKRYSTDPKADLKKLAVQYKDAMKAVVSRYPDDLDAATLYAESLMDLHPWQLWSPDGRPTEGTEEVIEVLESVLKRNPQHVGANHYYIHAVEASPHPERALPSAERLTKLVPAAGHLVHMPAHIFNRTGDYHAAAMSNEEAAAADRSYIKATGAQGLYPMMYYSHNLHFLAIASCTEGRFADAMKAAAQLEDNVGPHIKEMAMLDSFMATSTMVLIRFHRWKELIESREPDKGPITMAIWHFARGLAYAATGKVSSAETERTAFEGARKAVPLGASMGLNGASAVLRIADYVLTAKLASARQDPRAAIDALKKAVAGEDALMYDEPPAWFLPVRESLGAALFLDRDYAQAEAVFRADLQRNPRSGRSLFGLAECLKAQGKNSDSGFVRQQFEAAWKNADTKLSIQDL
jgi:tetratricopeptide (TPR) repeat protein